MKVDVWELSKSREAPRCFCAKAVFWNGGGKSGNRIRNAATGGTSETWDREMNTFGRWDKILSAEHPRASLRFVPNDPKEEEEQTIPNTGLGSNSRRTWIHSTL